MGEVKKYRKKPVVIEALQFTGDNITQVVIFASPDASYNSVDGMRIFTLEGTHKADIGDYIIKGIANEFYPCKPDIFLKTYEEVNE